MFHSFCCSCGIQNKTVNLALTNIPLMLVLPLNTLLYLTTWYNIRKVAQQIRDVIGKNAQAIRASNNSAKIMTSFVLAFLVQWWGMTVYGLVEYFGHSDVIVYMFVVTFTNLGGLFNGMVFVWARKIRNESRSNTHKVLDFGSTDTQLGGLEKSIM